MDVQKFINGIDECSQKFYYKSGVLFCEKIAIREVKTWLKEHRISRNSPTFVFSRNQIISNVSSYSLALKKLERKTKLNYALKANMNPTIVCIMRDLGCSVTLVSGFELELALRLCFEPEHIVFNGNGKQDWEIELAVSVGCLLNVDSLFNVKQTTGVCRRLQKQARILLRVNPDIDAKVHKYNTTGKSGSKFGVSADSLDDVLEEISSEPLLQLVGLHCHLGSTITDVSVFRDCTRAILALYRQLRSRGFETLTCLNLGGGLGIDYKRHASFTQPSSQADQATDILTPVQIPTPEDLVQAIDEALGKEEVSLILEPGRSLIGNAGILLTTVLGVKHGRQKNYIVTDGAMTEVIRPALYEAYHHIDLAEPTQETDSQKLLFDVVGPVCESGDFLGKDRYLSIPHEGCCLAVFDVGAYCASMSSNYNMRPRAAEVLVSGEKLELIRRPDSLEDILTPYNFNMCIRNGTDGLPALR